MHSDTYGTAWTWKPLRISPARSSGVELITAILCYTVHRMQINTNCSCYKTHWLESLHVPGIRKYDHITPVLRNLHWLPITARINNKIAVLTYKLLSTNTPSYLSEVISVHHPSRQLRSAVNRTLSVPYVRTQFGARAFRHAAPTIWNSLPASITSASSSLATFKRDLKTFYYKQSFP